MPEVDRFGAAQAEARVRAVFDRLDRLHADGLARIALAPPGNARRRELGIRAGRAAESAGRSALLEEARRSAGETVLQRFGDRQYRPTWFGLNWGVSMGGAADRAAAAAAVEDAVTAAVIEDLVDAETSTELMGPFEELASFAGTGPDGDSLADALSARPRWVPVVAALLATLFVGGMGVAAAGAIGLALPIAIWLLVLFLARRRTPARL